jgi:tetratricopeptide (TPR) repeat protein
LGHPLHYYWARREDAIRHLNLALKAVNPADKITIFWNLMDLGEAYVNIGQYDLAQAQYAAAEKTLAGGPENPFFNTGWVEMFRSSLYHGKKEFDKALAAADKAIAVADKGQYDHLKAWATLSKASIQKRQQKWDEALKNVVVATAAIEKSVPDKQASDRYMFLFERLAIHSGMKNSAEVEAIRETFKGYGGEFNLIYGDLVVAYAAAAKGEKAEAAEHLKTAKEKLGSFNIEYQDAEALVAP